MKITFSCRLKSAFSRRVRAALGLLALGVAALAQQSILQSPHNLSASGPGSVRAVSEERVCIFCHTPHGSRTVAPLWNRRDSTASYIPYNSPSLKAQPGQPTGASKLCLSCHDGTIALGDVISEPSPIQMVGSQFMTGDALLGTNLSNDHPISFNYFDAFSQLSQILTAPTTWPSQVKLDPANELQCTTCHDPHNDQFGDFLVMDNIQSNLCRVCHNYNLFEQTPHATSTRIWNGAGLNPWPDTDFKNVQDNACLNCHEPHHAGGAKELVTFPKEEDVCFVCHNGNVAQFNMQAVFLKPFHHPVELTQGVHQDGETPLQNGNHVECVDCHDPHSIVPSVTQPPQIQGVMEGSSGVDSGGQPVNTAIFEYQVCFKCHGDRQVQPPLNAIPRVIPSTNALHDFSLSSPSFHPVEGPGRNSDVPSLISPLTPASIIYCSNCHNNDQATPGSPDTNGPHGSNFEFILARQYRTGDNVPESPQAYALCYGCHSETSILAGESFPLHGLHVSTVQAPCSVCHDAHGIDFDKGNAINNAHLMNFDTSVVQKDSVTGRLEYRTTGPRSGECFLRCHNVDHSPKSY